MIRGALWATVLLNLLGVYIFAYWLSGDLTADVALKASPDLVLAMIFLWWAFGAVHTQQPRVA